MSDDVLREPPLADLERLAASDDPFDQAVFELWRGRSLISSVAAARLSRPKADALLAALARLDATETALRDVPFAYESKVSRALDFTLPSHSDECDGNETSKACLRCYVLAHIQVAYGMARPLDAVVLVSEPAAECQVGEFSSRMCARGTKGCDVQHAEPAAEETA